MKIQVSILSLISAVNISMPAYATTERTIPSGGVAEYVLGTGYDSDRDVSKGDCVGGATTHVGKPISDFSFDQKMDRDTLSKELNITAKAEYNTGATSAKAEASFVTTSTDNDFSLSAVYKGFYQFEAEVLKDYTDAKYHKPLFDSYHDHPARFRDVCGDEFIWQAAKGARLIFSLRIDFSSKKEKEDFAAKVSASYSLASASAELKNNKESFSAHTRVRVTALQIGGDVTQITKIFGDSKVGDGSATGFVQCSFGDFTKCDAVIAQAIRYASSETDGFPSQFKKGHTGTSGSAVLQYVTKSFRDMGVDLPPAMVTSEINKARARLDVDYKNTSEPLDKISGILGGVVPLSPKQRSLLKDEQELLKENLNAIISTANTCYTTPDECIDAEQALQPTGSSPLKTQHPEVFNINPETFEQYCRLKDDVVATYELRTSMEALIAQAKKLRPHAFEKANEKVTIDDCQVAETVFQAQKNLSLRGLGLSTVAPLAGLTNLVSLDVSDNKIEDLSSLGALNGLEQLNARNNRLQDIKGVEGMTALRQLDISGNVIRDTNQLDKLNNLKVVDVRRNPAQLSCARAVSCIKTDPSTLYQFTYADDLRNWWIREAGVARLQDADGGKVLFVGVQNIPSGSWSGISTALSYGSLLVQPGFGAPEVIVGGLPRFGPQATTLKSGKVLVSGDLFGQKDLEIFDPKTKTFQNLPIHLHQARAYHTATLLPDGRVLIAGGLSVPMEIGLQEAELIDVDRSTVTSVMMTSLRGFHTATSLASGEVLLTGGQTSNGSNRTAEVFDWRTDTFSPVGSMSDGRLGHTATLLRDKTVLIAGGATSGGLLTTMEIYNPMEKKFSPAPFALRTARAFHAATLTKAGKVLFVGGQKEIPQPTLNFSEDKGCPECSAGGEVLDPENGVIDDIEGAMHAPRSSAVIVPGENGVLYVFGGEYSESATKIDAIETKEKQ